jgi:PAS domain S-box-containing protein
MAMVELKVWPLLIAGSFAGFILFDVQAGVSLKSIAWFLPADTVQALISGLGLRYCFRGVPQLDSIRSLAKYSLFAVLLAPFFAAFLSAHGIGLDYWTGWRICFFSEVLAFVTVTPAILSWVNGARSNVRISRARYLESTLQFAGLVLLSFIAFSSSSDTSSPVLLYSLVPFLLWAPLRLGSVGVSTSVIVVSFFSIWGAVHGRGPFVDQGPVGDPLLLQLFLIFAAAPFMVLATVVEERKRAQEEQQESERRFRLAAQAGRMFAYQWDSATDMIIRSGDCAPILGVTESDSITGEQAFAKVHLDDRERLLAAIAELTPEDPYLRITYRILHPNGTIVWVERNSEAYFDASGKLLRITGMVADVTQRKLTEEALRESEERFQLAAQAGKVYAYEWQVGSENVVRSSEHGKILGMTEPGQITYLQFLHKVHPDDRPTFLAATAALTPEQPSCEITYRFMRPGGEIAWLKNRGRGFFDEAGRLLRVIGMVADVTDHKLAEEALSNVSGRLLEAQEQERIRIARELHDDICQRLALLSISLDQVRKYFTDSPPEVCDQMSDLQEQLMEITSDVQLVSHELHSSTLEHLGLVQAASSWCHQFSQRQQIDIQFNSCGISSNPAPEISLCIFRVLQEAVHNASKHSESNRVDVQLWEDSGDLHLMVSDLGKGFNIQAAMQCGGLGLTSMQERVRLVNGTIVIDSKPMCGTKLHARVPVPSEYVCQQAAG